MCRSSCCQLRVGRSVHVICFVSSGRSAASVASWVSVGLPLRHRYESVPPMVVMGPVKAGRPSEPVSADALALTMMNGPDGLALYSHGRRAGSMRVLLNVTGSGTMRRSCDSSHCATFARSVSLTFDVAPLFHTPPESSIASMSESRVRLFCVAVNWEGRRCWSPIVISTSSNESLPLSDLTRFALMTT